MSISAIKSVQTSKYPKEVLEIPTIKPKGFEDIENSEPDVADQNRRNIDALGSYAAHYNLTNFGLNYSSGASVSGQTSEYYDNGNMYHPYYASKTAAFGIVYGRCIGGFSQESWYGLGYTGKFHWADNGNVCTITYPVHPIRPSYSTQREDFAVADFWVVQHFCSTPYSLKSSTPKTFKMTFRDAIAGSAPIKQFGYNPVPFAPIIRFNATGTRATIAPWGGLYFGDSPLNTVSSYSGRTIIWETNTMTTPYDLTTIPPDAQGNENTWLQKTDTQDSVWQWNQGSNSVYQIFSFDSANPPSRANGYANRNPILGFDWVDNGNKMHIYGGQVNSNGKPTGYIAEIAAATPYALNTLQYNNITQHTNVLGNVTGNSWPGYIDVTDDHGIIDIFWGDSGNKLYVRSIKSLYVFDASTAYDPSSMTWAGTTGINLSERFESRYDSNVGSNYLCVPGGGQTQWSHDGTKLMFVAFSGFHNQKYVYDSSTALERIPDNILNTSTYSTAWDLTSTESEDIAYSKPGLDRIHPQLIGVAPASENKIYVANHCSQGGGRSGFSAAAQQPIFGSEILQYDLTDGVVSTGTLNSLDGISLGKNSSCIGIKFNTKPVTIDGVTYAAGKVFIYTDWRADFYAGSIYGIILNTAWDITSGTQLSLGNKYIDWNYEIGNVFFGMEANTIFSMADDGTSCTFGQGGTARGMGIFQCKFSTPWKISTGSIQSYTGNSYSDYYRRNVIGLRSSAFENYGSNDRRYKSGVFWSPDGKYLLGNSARNSGVPSTSWQYSGTLNSPSNVSNFNQGRSAYPMSSVMVRYGPFTTPFDLKAKAGRTYGGAPYGNDTSEYQYNMKPDTLHSLQTDYIGRLAYYYYPSYNNSRQGEWNGYGGGQFLTDYNGGGSHINYFYDGDMTYQYATPTKALLTMSSNDGHAYDGGANTAERSKAQAASCFMGWAPFQATPLNCAATSHRGSSFVYRGTNGSLDGAKRANGFGGALAMSPDGTKVYWIGQNASSANNFAIYQCTLNTPYEISSTNFRQTSNTTAKTISFWGITGNSYNYPNYNVIPAQQNPYMFWSADGYKLFMYAYARNTWDNYMYVIPCTEPFSVIHLDISNAEEVQLFTSNTVGTVNYSGITAAWASEDGSKFVFAEHYGNLGQQASNQGIWIRMIDLTGNEYDPVAAKAAAGGSFTTVDKFIPSQGQDVDLGGFGGTYRISQSRFINACSGGGIPIISSNGKDLVFIDGHGNAQKWVFDGAWDPSTLRHTGDYDRRIVPDYVPLTGQAICVKNNSKIYFWNVNAARPRFASLTLDEEQENGQFDTYSEIVEFSTDVGYNFSGRSTLT